MNDNKRRLGRGLDALLPSSPPPASPKVGTQSLPIESLKPVAGQPRRVFDDAHLDELAASLKELGMIEPIAVRPKASGDFEIVAGERRWRAAQRAGFRTVPVIVHNWDDKQAFEAAIVENVQREDLNPIEVAMAYGRLLKEFGHTHESIADRIGKDRSTVVNAIRLLKLPESVQGLVSEGKLSEGHARALLTAKDVASMEKLARAAIAEHWSVRELERRARGDSAGSKGSGRIEKTANIKDLELRLSRRFGAKTEIQSATANAKVGKVVFNYSSLEELDRLLAEWRV